MAISYATSTLTFSDGVTYSFEISKQTNMDQLGRTIYTLHVTYEEDQEWCSSIWDYLIDTKLQYVIRTLTGNNYSSDDLLSLRDVILNSEYKEKNTSTEEESDEASNS